VFVSFTHFQDVQGLTAYIDGGTGSMLFQAAIGGMLTLSYLLGTGYSRIKSAVMARVKKARTTQTDD
jgi:hypothetical protein